MNVNLLIVCCSIPLFSFEQSLAVAPVKVIVTNEKSIGIPNDKILFIGKQSGKIISGITDAKGAFKINLPADEIYDIKIVAIGDAMEYSTIEIPALPEGSSFREMLIQIMYEMASTFTLSNLNFETSKADIKADSYETLNELVEYLKRKKGMRILIGGHTDNLGTDESNKLLSKERANNVQRYLSKKGISKDRIETEGFGENKPIEDNSTAEGRAKNRRTEIYIIK